MKGLERFRVLGARILLGALFIFAIYSNIRLVLQNYQLHQAVASAQTQLDALNLKDKKLNLLLTYYQSDSYQEVEARGRLGLKKPDEQVVVVKGLSEIKLDSDGLDDPVYQSQPSAAPTAPTKSNIQNWADYFFGKK